ncbi:MAG TPA: LPS export ABC transporter periplasmic protein LptC [Oscillatoriales cyanobacterium M59_W2019_021]|nr:MAG: LPS export ABC transporter periplasmic protein LptC [Cyanobacteria bacterium J055]HIK31885.1 LPS export ABC transporter periplasmic protein LptC [Oscillatoriales cyanobacterium M4454_W2019_049]HIK51444.1 LPS export ABC transporter periplasmic protein LptC [Oscillatoriales cyanobacterium M59_W2019_021]
MTRDPHRQFSRPLGAIVLGIALSVGIAACTKKPPESQKADGDRSAAPKVETNLTFNDITLEQVDEQGKLVWVVKGKQATYSSDRQLAALKKPQGELYQDGKLVFKIEAEQGEIHQNGEKILLKDKVVATDIQDNAVVRGDTLEWLPKKDTLTVRGNLQGTHEEADVTAQEARLFGKKRRMELLGEVIMRAKESSLQIASDSMIWEMEQKLAISDKPVQIDRYEGEGDAEKVTDRATADRAQVQLDTQVATLQQNAQLALVDPPVQVASNELIWDLPAERLTSNVPVRVVHNEQKVTLSGNNGWIDLAAEVFQLNDGIEAISQTNQAQLIANQLTWNIPTQEFVAEGDVTYRQVDPPLSVNGPRAEGQLQEQTFSISGGRVTTEIVP